RKNSKNAGRAQDKALGTKFYKKIKFFKIFKFAAGYGHHTSRRHRDRNTEAGCRHRPEEMAGDTSRERRTR
ncbi:unnamed protein product, partial [Staurois parvus]